MINNFSALNVISPEIITEASKYTLQEYYSSHLATRRSFFRKLNSEQIMKWSNSIISSPLLKIASELEETSIQLFKNLISYMGDRRSSKLPIKHVKKHLKLTLFSTEDLKDEAYAQVLKQIKDHKIYDRAMRGWNFFAILASCYAPSTDLYYSILNYLIGEIRTNTDPNITRKSNYIVLRLVNSYESKRKQIPSDDEVLHIENMKQMLLPIYFFSETHTMIPTESYTRVMDLKSSIMKKLQLSVSKIPYYSLYEVCIKDNVCEERFLDDLERFVDITAVWAKEREEYKLLKKQIEFKIYLKIQIYYPYKEDDIDTITMHYVQTNYDVISGKYKLTDEEIVQLAAIQLQVDCEKKSFEDTASHLERHTRNYIPCTKYKSGVAGIWCGKIMEYYTTNLKFTSRIESKLTYLECMKKNPLFEAHQFFVTFSSSFNVSNYENLPDNLILAIKPDSVSFLDLDRNELKTIYYNQIISWGVSNSIFVIVIPKNNNEYVKYYFETVQVRLN
jgi:myosin VIIa